MRSNRPDAPGAVKCRCGCPAETHVHLRPGSDCGCCGNNRCEVYRRHDGPGWREPPLSPIESVWEIEGWVAYGGARPDLPPT